jgi:uncharacterized protein YndB with AHSA1/START domain
MSGFVAAAETEVDATPERVWTALTDPDEIAQYMWGTRVETTWQVGSPITWTDVHEGRTSQDKGEVLTYDEPHVLSVTHFSPAMGKPDEPESYHTLVYTVTARGEHTHLELTQDGCDSEAQAEEFSSNWRQMLETFKSTVEG